MPSKHSILPTPRGRRCRQLIIALAALAALSTVASTAEAKTNRHNTSVIRSAPLHAKKATKPGTPPRNPYASLANYAAGYMTEGNNVPEGGNRYEPGFAGWAAYATGYAASQAAG